MSYTKDEFRTSFFLGERWGQQDKKIRDLACNVFADKVVLLDLLIDNSDDPKMKEDLETIREIILKRGEALWIKKADTVTNLSIKVGMPIDRISLKSNK